jgi:hypothetical protein
MTEKKKGGEVEIRPGRGAAPSPGRDDRVRQKFAQRESAVSRVLNEQELWAIVAEGHLKSIGKESDGEID